MSLSSGAPSRALMSVDEVAALLGVSAQTVRRESGKSLPEPVAIGGCRRWRSEEILAIVSAAI